MPSDRPTRRVRRDRRLAAKNAAPTSSAHAPRPGRDPTWQLHPPTLSGGLP
jgi:hypothetical protein